MTKSYIEITANILSSMAGDTGLFHIETSTLISCVNQWAGFHMIGTSVMKGLNDMMMVMIMAMKKKKIFNSHVSGSFRFYSLDFTHIETSSLIQGRVA